MVSANLRMTNENSSFAGLLHNRHKNLKTFGYLQAYFFHVYEAMSGLKSPINSALNQKTLKLSHGV